MGLTGHFEHTSFQKTMNQAIEKCRKHKVPSGIHVVQPNPKELQLRINEGHRFIAFSVDSVFLIKGSQNPEELNRNEINSTK